MFHRIIAGDCSLNRTAVISGSYKHAALDDSRGFSNVGVDGPRLADEGPRRNTGLSSDVPTIFFITSSPSAVASATSCCTAASDRPVRLACALVKRSGLETFPAFGTVFDGRPPLDLGCSCRHHRHAAAVLRALGRDRSPINKRAYGRGLRRYGCTL